MEHNRETRYHSAGAGERPCDPSAWMRKNTEHHVPRCGANVAVLGRLQAVASNGLLANSLPDLNAS